MPLGELAGIRAGSLVRGTGRCVEVPVGESLLGRVVDGLGRPIDGLGPLRCSEAYPIEAPAPEAMRRPVISRPLATGVRAIDGLLTLGEGQRMGIFAGSGVGKSTLLGMIARYCAADVNVIALVGERGREVREFLENDLGEEGLRRSVVVCATSEQPALVRIKGALAATAIAEWFRDRGANVLLMMDSVTRFAMAQREVGLAIGEPPSTKGYTPSVFALLPKLMERAGTSDRGSITALYTVLVEGDDTNEPISDAARSKPSRKLSGIRRSL
jgi:flagellum-specific ATP synthase